MSWLIAALIAPFVYAGANTLDSQLSNRHFRSVGALIFVGMTLGALFLPLAFIFGRPQIPPLATFGWLVLIGFLEIAYLFPYYAALRYEDSSVVTALFAMGDLFVPLLSYFILHERLHTLQYVGFAAIVLGSAALAWRPGARPRSKKALLYMSAVALILAFDLIIYKIAFSSVDWATGFFWPRLFTFSFSLLLLAVPSIRKDIVAQSAHAKKILPIFLSEEFLTFLASAFITYALTLAPATVIRGIGGIGPIIVLLYALILGRRFPKAFSEATDRGSVIRKIICSVLMIIGVVLVVG